MINGFKSKKAVVKAVGVNKNDNSDSMFVDLRIWKSENLPNFPEIEKYYSSYAEKTGLEDGAEPDKFSAYSAGFGDEFAESTRKIDKMDGFTVKTQMKIQKPSGEAVPDSGKMNMSELMKGMFGKDIETHDESEYFPGRTTIISITEEVTSVSDSTISDNLFEVPEGFIRID